MIKYTRHQALVVEAVYCALLTAGYPMSARGLIGFSEQLLRLTTPSELASIIRKFRRQEWFPLDVHTEGPPHTYGIKDWMLSARDGFGGISVVDPDVSPVQIEADADCEWSLTPDYDDEDFDPFVHGYNFDEDDVPDELDEEE
jgi:hypothetical protein